MIYTLNPSKDTTIYEFDQTRNTGVDQMLELHKHTVTPTVNGIKNSRILMSFDLTEYNAAVSGVTVNKMDLQLWSANTNNVSNDYIVEFRSNISTDFDWGMGTGLLVDNPAKTNGANWTTKDGVNAYSANNIRTLQGSVTKSVNDNSDILVDLTTLWTQESAVGSINMWIKRPDAEEQSAVDLGHLQYFSNETKTIYRPQLNIHWDDSSYTLGTQTVITDDNIRVLAANAKTIYSPGERTKLSIKAIPMNKLQGYSTGSLISSNKNLVLPVTSLYKITDVVSGEDVHGYYQESTKVSCDAYGSYMNLWTDTLVPNREYSVSIKVVNRGYSGRIEYFNDVHNFRVEG
jgi:hypothetical protein